MLVFVIVTCRLTTTPSTGSKAAADVVLMDLPIQDTSGVVLQEFSVIFADEEEKVCNQTDELLLLDGKCIDVVPEDFASIRIYSIYHPAAMRNDIN